MGFLPVILIACGVAGSFAWWLTLARRPDLRRKLWPAFRFRPAPWGAFDVLGAFFLVLLMAGLPWDQGLLDRDATLRDGRLAAGNAAPSALPGMEADRPAESRRSGEISPENGSLAGLPGYGESRLTSAESDQNRSHGLWILLQDRPTPATFLLCFLVAVIAAPLMEETLFRLLFQGWLATRELRLRRRLKGLSRAPGRDAPSWIIAQPRWFGLFSVSVVAACFSLIHIRSTSDVPSADAILAILLRQLCGYGAALPLLVLWLAWGRGVRARMWGLARETFWPDVLLGLRWFATLAVPIYGLQVGLSAITPDSVVVDPLTLFPFGFVSGLLCLRSGRLLPAIVFHMALNGTSLTLAAMLLLSGALS
ncbi:MAG: CPBP family intramembrane metalloprotease [Thermogutta sp.]|nr:CPBP family intramembrane metalloprotease [Thermogutta sp.]